ncbi:hypothetical protein M9Y10_021189 [Tritrichomonas musculus]|uniref:Peptidase C14 caspase domain-containing protein n=1 Tax=Tritrichomonas musculus TaxID=1915356 RepID=A0ABR2HEA4_9EUKA
MGNTSSSETTTVIYPGKTDGTSSTTTTTVVVEEVDDHDTDSSDDDKLEELRRKQREQFRLNRQMKREEFQKLRASNTEEDALAAMKHLGNCVNDKNPEDCPYFLKNGINSKMLLVIVNTYVKPQYKLGVGPLNDAITVSVSHKKMGYKMLFLHNTTPTHFKKWLKFVLKNTQKDLTIFYTGHGCSLKDKTGEESDGYDEVMLFDNGYVLDDELSAYLAKYAHGQRILLLSDCCHSGSMWDIQSMLQGRKQIASNIMSISAAKDDQTAKQTKVNSKDQGIFTYYFWEIWEDQNDITVKDMETKINPNISYFKQHFTFASTTESMKFEPIFPNRERFFRGRGRRGRRGGRRGGASNATTATNE